MRLSLLRRKLCVSSAPFSLFAALTALAQRPQDSLSAAEVQSLTEDLFEFSADDKTLTSGFTGLTPRKDGHAANDGLDVHTVGGKAKPYPFVGTWKLDRQRTKWGEDPWPLTKTVLYRLSDDGKAMKVRFRVPQSDGKILTTTSVYERQ